MERYTIIHELGSGSYGKVYLAKQKSSGLQVAIKEIHTEMLQPDQKEKALKEVQLLSSLKHPNIVSHIESFDADGKLYIVMEYLDGGDLSGRISSAKNGFSEKEILSIFIQICLALKYVHDRKIVHRDVKPQNIFLTNLGIAKLGDFGVSKALDGTADLCKTVIGTPYYLSPEVWTNAEYDSKTDVWSLGCILYEMISLKKPFQGENPQQLFVNVVNGKYQKLPKAYSGNIRDLVANMLSPLPERRPTTQQILQLPFIIEHSQNMINANEQRLKCVNVISKRNKSSKSRNVLRYSSNNGNSVSRSEQNHDTNISVNNVSDLNNVDEKPIILPLPDEEPPSWVKKYKKKKDSVENKPVGDNGNTIINGKITKVPNLESEELGLATNDNSFDTLAENDGNRNEYSDLRVLTERLHDYVSSQPELPTDPEVAKVQYEELKEVLLKNIDTRLYSMLRDNFENSTQESCQQFLTAFKREDTLSYSRMVRLLSLEKIFQKD